MKVEFLEAAQAELDMAFEWHETQQTNLGRQFTTEFEAAIRRIIRYPLAYIVIDQQLRRCLIKRLPYAIFTATTPTRWLSLCYSPLSSKTGLLDRKLTLIQILNPKKRDKTEPFP